MQTLQRDHRYTSSLHLGRDCQDIGDFGYPADEIQDFWGFGVDDDARVKKDAQMKAIPNSLQPQIHHHI